MKKTIGLFMVFSIIATAAMANVHSKNKEQKQMKSTITTIKKECIKIKCWISEIIRFSDGSIEISIRCADVPEIV